MTARQHYRLQITGRVQGVGYRQSTAETARRLGLAGWVQNLPDGSVVAEIEGPEDVCQQLIAWCQQGPSLAWVSDVQVTPGEVRDFVEFEVRR